MEIMTVTQFLLVVSMATFLKVQHSLQNLEMVTSLLLINLNTEIDTLCALHDNMTRPPCFDLS